MFLVAIQYAFCHTCDMSSLLLKRHFPFNLMNSIQFRIFHSDIVSKGWVVDLENNSPAVQNINI